MDSRNCAKISNPGYTTCRTHCSSEQNTSIKCSSFVTALVCLCRTWFYKCSALLCPFTQHQQTFPAEVYGDEAFIFYVGHQVCTMYMGQRLGTTRSPVRGPAGTVLADVTIHTIHWWRHHCPWLCTKNYGKRFSVAAHRKRLSRFRHPCFHAYMNVFSSILDNCHLFPVQNRRPYGDRVLKRVYNI